MSDWSPGPLSENNGDFVGLLGFQDGSSFELSRVGCVSIHFDAPIAPEADVAIHDSIGFRLNHAPHFGILAVLAQVQSAVAVVGNVEPVAFVVLGRVTRILGIGL